MLGEGFEVLCVHDNSCFPPQQNCLYGSTDLKEALRSCASAAYGKQNL